MSLIGTGVTVTGNIDAPDDLVIEGRVEGDVTCSTLIVGEHGRVTGTVEAERLRLSGTIDGTVTTHDLAVESGARVTGEVHYSRLRVASGGVIEGRLTHRPDGDRQGDGADRHAPTSERPRKANGGDIAVFEDSSYRDDQRTSGGAG